jgi:DNA adenine methylase
MEEPKPFLRWAGGKRALIKVIRPLLPQKLLDMPYHEPFLGAGSLFFDIHPKKAWLSDANGALIDTYKWVRDDATSVLRYLKAHASAHSDLHYYATRDRYNSAANSPSKAAAFIYLNKACYNGVFRVNQKGKFNVPVGSKEIIVVPTKAEMESIGAALGNAKLHPQDFIVSLKKPKAGEFVYLDPPYPALNENRLL